VSSARPDSIPKDFHVIAPAHFDRTRYLTGLMGHRENLETQVLWDDTWISLPVTSMRSQYFHRQRSQPSATSLPPDTEC